MNFIGNRLKTILLILVSFFFYFEIHAQEVLKKEIVLISVQEIMDSAFQNSQVVIMNEAHSGQKRNKRSRIIGQLVLPKAHAHGVRFLAMEALYSDFADEANSTRKLPLVDHTYGYLNQIEMRELMQAALDLGWDLVPYKEDFSKAPKFENSLERNNWREKEQATNLSKALNNLEKGTNLLIWCGNSHLEKEPGYYPNNTEFLPMGYQFWQITGIEPFTIDQIVTVDFLGDNKRFEKWKIHETLLKENYHGTMGFLSKKNKSATIISLYNKLE